MKKVALIGCTGSIGRQVVNVVRRYPQLFELTALIARSSAEAFVEQARALRPAYAALTDRAAARNLCGMPEKTRLFFGEDGALKALEECGADVVFVACGGFDGLKYSLQAAKSGAVIALANKETLVCGGDLMMPLAQKLVPVDSEHSAIWQCLNFERKAPFSRLYITASGGAFRGRKWEELSRVTRDEALAHPTWKMGAKITIDSATLLNKGYEVIEAHHLYAAPYDKITAVLQPQSVVHSMVRFADGAILAQLSVPTMELPIQLALTYPERLDLGLRELDFSVPFSLDFAPLDRRDYPMFDLALTCGREGGVLPTALNAASEVADRAFLDGRIVFTDIYTVAERVVAATVNGAVQSYEQLAEVDSLSRRLAQSIIREAKW